MVSIIAAVAKNGVIGTSSTKNGIPWELKEDQKRFLELTRGNPMLMGRTTFEINYNRLGRPFKSGRTSIVVTDDKNYKAPAEGVIVYTSLDEAINDWKDKNLWIIGGASIYKQTIDKADKLYITHVDQDAEGDVFFPKIDRNKWRLAGEEQHPGYTFAVYERV